MTAESTPVLSARSITLRAGARLLVDGLALTVAGGDLWAVLGRNGAGKSTLLATLAGLRPADAGQVLLGGRALDAWPLLEAARMRAFLPQVVHDAFGITVLELVLLGRHPYLGRWRWEGDEDHRIALRALAAVAMEDAADRDVLSLSGGERQRVALAQVLAQEPRVLLLDEPTAHLDMHHQIAIMTMLRSEVRDQGRAVLLATHDLALAARFATHVLVLRGDGTTCQGATLDVMTEATLSASFGHPLRRVEVEGAVLFAPR